MKYIFGLIMLCLFGNSSFASDEIQVSLSSRSISIDENFSYTIEIYGESLSPENISLSIPGIEEFSIFSQSVSQRSININGTLESFSLYSLNLRPGSQGEFTLGPVELILGSGSILDDQVLEIEVYDRATIIPLQSDEGGEKVQSEEGGDDGGIRDLRKLPFPWWGVVAGAIAFFSLFYLFLAYFISGQKKREVISDNSEKEVISKNEKIKRYFLSLKKENESLASQEFFKKYNLGMREILLEKGAVNAHRATLIELQNNREIKNLQVYKIFMKSYKYEYSQREISPATRNQYVDDILKNIDK